MKKNDFNKDQKHTINKYQMSKKLICIIKIIYYQL